MNLFKIWLLVWGVLLGLMPMFFAMSFQGTTRLEKLLNCIPIIGFSFSIGIPAGFFIGLSEDIPGTVIIIVFAMMSFLLALDWGLIEYDGPHCLVIFIVVLLGLSLYFRSWV